MTEALRVLALIALLGLAAAPVTRASLGRLPGAALGLAPTVGLLLAAWLAWLLASVGLLPWGDGAALAGIGGVAVLGLVAWRRATPPPDPLVRSLALAAAGLGLAAFAVLALLVAFSPDVWNTEKPMDMALVNVIGAGDELPPRDPWLAGETLNYYYLGHLAIALIVGVTDVEPTRGYNLGLAVVFALTVAGAFSLGAALAGGTRARTAAAAGLLAAALVAVLGNLDAARRLLADPGPLRTFDWFAPSRVIPDTINEFPAFSFTLGDLHAHVLAVPATLLVAALAVQILLAGPRWSDLPLTAIALGTLLATNAWSFPVGAGLVVLALLARRTGLAFAAAVLGASLLAIAPFLATYDPPPGGLGLVDTRRGLPDFLRDHALIYGVLLFLALVALAAHALRGPHALRNSAWAAVAGLVVGSLLASADLAGAALLLALAAVALHGLLSRQEPVFLLLAGGLGLLAIPELVYVRDEFDGTDLERMNTVFKAGFQAWLLLALAGAVAIRAVLARPVRVAGALGLAVLLAGALVYPVAGTYARKDGFSREPTLDGLRWLAAAAPGDPAAIAWLREHAGEDAVVLESAGDDYSGFGHARISTFTGIPAVLGWAGHVLQWGHDPGRRRGDVDTLYRTEDAARARVLLERYAVTHVVVGPLERADHGEAGTAKWARLGRRVFARAGTEVYETRSNSSPPGRRR